MAKKNKWVYGQSGNPKTWHETADILKAMQPKRKPKGGSGLYDRLVQIESLLKEKK